MATDFNPGIKKEKRGTNDLIFRIWKEIKSRTLVRISKKSRNNSLGFQSGDKKWEARYEWFDISYLKRNQVPDFSPDIKNSRNNSPGFQSGDFKWIPEKENLAMYDNALPYE